LGKQLATVASSSGAALGLLLLLPFLGLRNALLVIIAAAATGHVARHGLAIRLAAERVGVRQFQQLED
jgi:uncharacterized membrane protein